MADPIIGIDLGTTNSCVAFFDGKNVVVIPNPEGTRTTPSVVAFKPDGERLIGALAKRQAILNPGNTVFAIKRLIGRKFDSDEVRTLAASVPYEITGADNGDAWVKMGESTYSPPEISAMFLRFIKDFAQDYIGEKVEKAIITVPAYFNDAQRQATKDAGAIAGLQVMRIINEPTAASLAYGVDHDAERKIVAVFDLGGGTFDISILEIREGVYSVLATCGDTFLGGEDFDRKLIDKVCEKFLKDEGVDLHNEAMSLQRVKDEVEKAKIELSNELVYDLNLPFIYADDKGPRHIEMKIRRSDLEDWCSDLLDRLVEPCQTAISDAKLQAHQIDDILLVGGMTRMPAVQEKVGEIFGGKPNATLDPDEVVAAGAALQGGVLKGEKEDVVLLDVTPLSLGVETAGGIFHRIIPRNTSIPNQASEVFTTSLDNQNFVPVHVLQGEREMASDNQTLAKFELTGIPPAPRGVPQILVTFSLDQNGIVSVRAKDMGTGREHKIRVTTASGLSEDQIEEMIRSAEDHQLTDQARKQRADLVVQAEGLIYTTKKALEEFGDKIATEDAEVITSDIERLKQLIEDGSNEDLKTATTDLEASAYHIAEVLYGTAEGEGSDEERPSEEPPELPDLPEDDPD
jgi:molecular chaperone DnaK